jgi:hypothetical protein
MGNPKTLSDLAISDTGFVFDPSAGGTYSVNPTGLCVLHALKEGLPKRAIAERLADRFRGSPADLGRDVDEFIHLLRQNHLVPVDFTVEG